MALSTVLSVTTKDGCWTVTPHLPCPWAEAGEGVSSGHWRFGHVPVSGTQRASGPGVLVPVSWPGTSVRAAHHQQQ